jgi:DNA-binding MarR family transcriptional regulator
VPLQLALLLELGSFSAASARALALDLKVPTSSIVGAATQLRKAGLLERTQRKQQDLAVHYRLTTLGLAARRGLQT